MTPRRLAKVGGLVLAALLCAARPVAAQTADTLSATEIVRRADDLLRGKTQQGKYRMTIVRPDWQRTTEFAFWSEGTEKSFIRVLEPPKDRGVAFLKIGRQMWQYIPRINRVIKIPPSMMLESWMGSDFTNDDLVKMESLVADYEHTIVARKGAHILVRSVPRPDAAVVWGKIETELDTRTALPVQARYYDEQGRLVRTIFFKEPKRLGGRLIPTRWLLVPADAPEKRTELVIEDARFGIAIPDARFSRARLRHP